MGRPLLEDGGEPSGLEKTVEKHIFRHFDGWVMAGCQQIFCFQHSNRFSQNMCIFRPFFPVGFALNVLGRDFFLLNNWPGQK